MTKNWRNVKKMEKNYNKDNLTVLNHPLYEHNLCLLRDKKITSDVFRNSLRRLAAMLIYEAAKVLPLQCCNVETPLMQCEANKLDEKAQIIFAPILRAGLALSDVASEIIPEASIQHVGMYRDESTLTPIWYYDKTPVEFKSPENTKVFILDPMLATGNSAKETVGLFIKRGISIENIVFISILSAPEGLHTLTSNYPELKIVTGKVDNSLNDKGYILPGLGDAGDRLFNTFEK